ncbi:hypothetical protein ACFE04_019112 [Oxalis oulophora]
MDRIQILGLLIFLSILFHVDSQNSDIDNSPSADAVSNFRPSLAVVIGILFIMFILTFILLVYAKFCHRTASSAHLNRPILVRSASRYSGIDKTVIESLPFFRFSALRGTKDGLECAVCLSKFEDIEVLRLLPKCKHAFHINCVDQWLEKHSSCPLCRVKVKAEDVSTFTYSNSMRFLEGNQSDRSNVEIYVEREEEKIGGSTRFSFRKSEKDDTDKEDIEALIESENGQKPLHKHNHRIIASDLVFKHRWSNVSSSDLMFLSSEMLNAKSSNRFSHLESNYDQVPDQSMQIAKIKDEMEMKSKVLGLGLGPTTSDIEKVSIISSSKKIVDPTERRVMSEITGVSRFGRDLNMTEAEGTSSSSVEADLREERTRQLWLPIARRTAKWFANRESFSQQQPHKNITQTLDV